MIKEVHKLLSEGRPRKETATSIICYPEVLIFFLNDATLLYKIIMLGFVNHSHFSKKCRNFASTFHFK